MCAAAVRKLAGEVMAFEEGLPTDALSTGGPTWPHERRRRWRALLETTTRLPDVSFNLNRLLFYYRILSSAALNSNNQLLGSTVFFDAGLVGVTCTLLYSQHASLEQSRSCEKIVFATVCNAAISFSPATQ